MSNKEDINAYCSYFKERLEEIKTIENRLYCKILVVTMIDSLARAGYPAKGNRERFISFIKSFSCWREHCRVSLPQLVLKLQSDSTNSEFEREVKERLRNWQSARIYRINEVDPCEKELEKLATTPESKRLIEKSTHAELLYIYRNHLVHEFREPGHPMEISHDNTSPYYFSGELVYPVGFFISITEISLANLKHHLEENDINPYSSYQFGSIWRPNRSE
jgi:hypothetical protein